MLNSDIERVAQAYSGGGAAASAGSLGDVLAENGLSQYESAFINDLGCTEIGDLEYVTAEDLAEIGIQGPKARRLLQNLK